MSFNFNVAVSLVSALGDGSKVGESYCVSKEFPRLVGVSFSWYLPISWRGIHLASAHLVNMGEEASVVVFCLIGLGFPWQLRAGER